MDLKDAEFLKKLRGIFKGEAEDHIRMVITGLLNLENSPAAEKQAEIIETVFCEVHSLKGSARSVGLKDIESICHPMETLFSALKRKEVSLTVPMLELLHRCVDFITPLVSAEQATLSGPERLYERDLIKQLEMVSRKVAPPAEKKAPNQMEKEPVAEVIQTASPVPLPVVDEKSVAGDDGIVEPLIRRDATPHLADTVRIPTSKLDPLLFQAEEMIMAKLAGVQRKKDLQEIHDRLSEWQIESGIWRNRLPSAPDQSLSEYFEKNESVLRSLQSSLLATTQAMDQDQRNLRRMVDEHLEAMKQVLMLPVSVLTESFPKMVHDLSHDQGKEVDLVLAGGDIEMDKRILEDLKAPLIHLLRNGVDHGMKTPQERVARNKRPRGTINLTFTALENRHVEICLSDDGEGIDDKQVKAFAVKAGFISRETAEGLNREEALALIFQSGLSTSAIITDISGRGLGMTIVHDKVLDLGGTIAVETKLGLGTMFRIVLPLTLATFRGILVRTGEAVFALPTANVERMLRVKPEEIRTVENRETISLDNRLLSLVKLSRALELPNLPEARPMREPGSSSGPKLVCIAVLRLGETRMGFQVDEVLAEHQILIKSLGKQLARVRNIAGATVLGNGRVILVLHVGDLLKSGVKTLGEGLNLTKEARPSTRTRKILTVDDSITARTLIRNILENAGYHVTSAVDGAEAFALARSEDFDLLVSDVDMPRLSGFELAARIRADKKLRELPIVLVTALDSREDRERGLDVGANAYIVKSRFDQSNLLEVIQRLLY